MVSVATTLASTKLLPFAECFSVSGGHLRLLEPGSLEGVGGSSSSSSVHGLQSGSLLSMALSAMLPILFVLYFATAIVFQLNLPRESLGKVAVVVGFAVWSLVFLFHSWVSNHPGYDAIADEIWNLQKFLVTIGMLLVQLEQQVSTNEWHAFHDHLSGLPNQRLFEDRLSSAIKQSQFNNTRTALLMVDLDGFKLINDTHGHDVGDELLRHIAQNLRAVIRPPDTLARLGGDEFIIIATDLPNEQPVNIIADTSAARIPRALHKPVSVNGSTLTVTGSIGVAVFPDDATDQTVLRRLADQRMYQEKRNIVSF